MAQHRKYKSEVPKLFIEGGSPLSSIFQTTGKIDKVNKLRQGSNVPVNNFILATSNITDPNNESERDNLKKSKILTNIQEKQEAGFVRSQNNKKMSVSYAESKAFSEIKRSFLDDEHEGIPGPLLFLKEIIKKETDPEDEYATKSYFCMIKVDELIATVLTINTIFGSVIYHELKKTVSGVFAIDVTLYFVTINSMILGKF
jgi:hypothetical protein